MNTKNNRRRQESRHKIEQIFVRLVQTKDIKDITVTEICTLAEINRSTFYANYLDVYDLVEKIREQMIADFRQLYEREIEHGYNSNDYLKLFRHIKDNKLFYKTYFKLHFEDVFNTGIYDTALAQKYYNNQHVDYHCEFFRAGITAIIKMWIKNDCDLTPEELFDIVKSEYEAK